MVFKYMISENGKMLRVPIALGLTYRLTTRQLWAAEVKVVVLAHQLNNEQ